MKRKIQCPCCGTVRVVNKTSGFIGVDFHKPTNKWRARATDNNRSTYHLGYYNSEEEASLVYDNFIVKNKIMNRPLNHITKKNNNNDK